MILYLMNLKYLLFSLLLLTGLSVFSIQLPVDTTPVIQQKRYFFRDSAYLAERARLQDSVYNSMLVLKKMQSNSSPLLDSIIHANKRPGLNIHNFQKYFKFNTDALMKKQGAYLPKGEAWGLGLIGGLLVLFSLLRLSVSRQLYTIVQAFFNNRVLGNLNKEENLFTSWPFIMLFVVFGFIIGMFYYLVSQYYQLAGGFQYYLSISAGIILLYFGKIVLLKFIGFLLNIGKVINEYVTILFLCYFIAGLMFLPLVVAFVLSPLKYGVYYIITSYIILILIGLIQFIRAGVNILSANRFPLLYLFLYFCALEICPILILIKAIDY